MDTLRIKGPVLAIILFCIISAASALPAPSCDAYDSSLIDTVATEVSGNGNVIAVGGAGGTIGAFTPEGSTLWVHRIPDHVTGIAVSGDGRSVAAATLHGELYYFDDEGRLLWNHSGFGCNSRVALSRDGQESYVISGSPTHDLTGDTVFHVDGNGSVLSRLPVPGVSSYDLSPDGRVAVVNSGGTQGSNYVVAIDDAGIRWEKTSPRQWHVPLVAVSDNCDTIAAAEPDVLTVFSCHGWELWNTSTKYMARAVAVSGDGQHVALGTQFRVLYFNRSGSLLWKYPVPDYVGNVKVSQDGSKIIATTRETLYYIDENSDCLWVYPLHDWTGSLSMSDAGDVIAAGTYNNTFTILDGHETATEIDLGTVPASPIEMTGTKSFISISPVRDHSVGEILEISGTTNLPVNTTLWISAGPKTFTNYPPNYFDGQVKVLPGQENNRWSVLMNTSSFTVDEYSVIVHTLNNTFPTCETTFNMTPRRVITPPTTNVQPTRGPDIPVSQPVPENNVIINHPKPVTRAPLPVEVSMGALEIMLILTRGLQRKNG